MTEFLTWNADGRRIFSSDIETLMMKIMIVLWLVFIVLIVADIIDRFASRCLDKRIIAWDANVIDAEVYAAEHLPPGMECYHMEGCGRPPLAAYCKKQKCAECDDCVPASLSDIEKDKLWSDRIIESVY